ncbi:MAG: nitroreductase family protein [Niastella sp.]|nr:nitroreductase family protein [Niastella sp.]
MNLTEALQWRYAVKRMNGTIIPNDKLHRILDAIRMAPTSSGLQPFEVFIISNPELKNKIQPIAFNQPQISQASHILVFAVWDGYTEQRINDFFSLNNQERNIDSAVTDVTRKRIIKSFSEQTAEEQMQHTSRQSAIAMGFGLVAAAIEKVDSTPMEGFDADRLDELLGLREKRLKSDCILALGYRDEDNDWAIKLKKVRRPKHSLFTFIE